MSGDSRPGYLARLVTRLTGEPAIRPRAVSRFEIGGGGQRDVESTVEGQADHFASPDEPRPDRRVPGPPTRTQVLHGRRGTSADAPHMDLGALVRRLTEDDPQGVADPSPAERPDAPRSVLTPSGPVAASRRAEPSPAADATEPDPRPIRAVARAVRTISLGETGPARIGTQAASRFEVVDQAGRSGRREPDIVQVHIGRIEVRAIGAAVPTPPPAAPPAIGPRPLSLERYLAGERRS